MLETITNNAEDISQIESSKQSVNRLYAATGYSENSSYHDNYIQSDKKIWSHSISDMEELKKKNPSKEVIYSPDPKLFVRSGIEKSSKKLCIIATKSVDSKIKEAVTLLQSRGYCVRKLDISKIEKRSLLRAYKESSFVILCNDDSTFNQVSLCGSGTPFILYNCNICSVAREFLENASLLEEMDIKNVLSVESNIERFSYLIERTLHILEKYLSWKDRAISVSDPTEKVFNKNVVFSQWSSIINEPTTCEKKEFLVSLQFCKGIVTNNMFVYKKLLELGVKVKYFWNGTVLYIGEDNTIVRLDMKTMKGEKQKEVVIKGDEVVVSEDSRKKYGVPALIPEDEAEVGYPLTYKVSLPLPNEIINYITEEKVIKSVMYI